MLRRNIEMPAKKASSKKPVAKKPVAKGRPRATPARSETSAQKAMAVQEEKWRAESDLRVLREARQIEEDAARLAKAKRLANQELKALQAIKNQ